MRRPLFTPVFTLVTAVLLWAAPAQAHRGDLEDMGCHWGRHKGDYHCHEGALEGRTFAQKTGARRALAKLERERVEAAEKAEQRDLMERARAVIEGGAPAAAVPVVPIAPVPGAPDAYGPYAATPVRVVDAATLELDLYLWPGLTQRTRVALSGVRVPHDTGAPCEAAAAREAVAFVEGWLAGEEPLTVSVSGGAASGPVAGRVARAGEDLGEALTGAGHGVSAGPGPWCTGAEKGE